MTSIVTDRRTVPFRFRGVGCLLASFVALIAIVLIPAVYGQDSIVQLDTAQTKIDFTLNDVLHTVHGLFRLKSGTIQFDPDTGKASGAIVVDATSGDSGNGGRDKRMHRDVLESGKFTEIVFTPNQVKGTLLPQGSSRLEVAGQFHLHGQDHEFAMPMDIQVDGQRLRLETHFVVPYVQWGLKNPSTFILRVGDKAIIDIHGVARIEGLQAYSSSKQ